jgi:hypothetical protein
MNTPLRPLSGAATHLVARVGVDSSAREEFFDEATLSRAGSE